MTEPLARPDQRLALEVLTLTGRATSVELQLSEVTVEVWHHRQLATVLDRTTLRRWLAEPGQDLVSDGVTLSLDRMVDVRGRVAISLPDVRAGPCPPASCTSCAGASDSGANHPGGERDRDTTGTTRSASVNPCVGENRCRTRPSHC